VYPMRFSFVADHFQYLAEIGIIAPVTGGMMIAMGWWKNSRPFLKPLLCGLLLLTFGVMTWRQCGMYADIETLWRTTIARNPDSWMAHYNLGVALLVAITLACTTPVGVVASLLVGLLTGTALPHMAVARMGKRRVAAFVRLFPEAIDLMVRALRSGLPISEAIIGAGREIGDPVGDELGRVEAGMRMGRDLEGLLWDIANRIDVPEFRFFIIALSVQRETGGNLAETLANLADVLRRRRQMRAKVRAMSSETRATTMILAGMPVLVIVMLVLTSPHYLEPLYRDIRGFLLDGLALAMLGTGVGIMTKMARFEI